MGSELNNLPEGELVRRSQAGSLHAFEGLVYRYEGRVYRFVAQICRNSSDAPDIVQETFLRAFQAIGQVDPDRPFAPWLFTVARRKCIDHFRAAPPVAVAEVPETPDPRTPASTLEDAERRRDIWKWARRHLSASLFEVLWLRYVEDLDIAEIATVTRRTRTHVKVLLFRARKILTGRLPEGEAGAVRGKVESNDPGRRSAASPLLTLGRKDPVL